MWFLHPALTLMMKKDWDKEEIVMKTWKKLVLKYPRIYLFSCWIILWLIGTALGADIAVKTAVILGLGYVANILWMYRM